MFIILRIHDMNPVFNRTAPNILAPHKSRAHNVWVPGAIQSLWALDEFVSSTLLLWWIWRNLSRLRFFLGAAAR